MADAHVNRWTTGGGEPRWKLQWRLDGRQGARSFRRESDADYWLQRVEDEGVRRAVRALLAAEAGDDDHDVPTVEWVVRESIRTRSGITQGTRDTYGREAERDIYPLIGSVPITELDDDRVRVWVNDLQAKGLAAKTIKNRHGLLSSAFGWAVERKLIDRNPAYRIKTPKVYRTPPVFLSEPEVAELCDVIDPRFRDLIIVLVGTGMRWGEITALQLQDVTPTPEGVVISVNKAWKDVHSGAMVLGPPKTPKGARQIPLDNSPVVDALKRQMSQRSKRTDLIFQSADGNTLRNGTFHSRVWVPLNKALADKGWLKRPRIHDLRHTAASLMLATNGGDIMAVSRVLGHEQVSTTVNVYGHLVNGAERRALAGLGQALGRYLL